ncbi:MAG: bifunctional diaminohydroxyphosphoribosylaminopyrimidine deaminase/5-amino-6-(5-phosphoribosylamino)uracil reductase RibD [Desulfovibrio sp.]|nr:bifunctional diaminohydroxyphosphoribosylaminopyrimidine deaminase/5-amino-6-(5-phosphoribosylamino)uracil reductase RibD [Desulfovibrio sp.]
MNDTLCPDYAPFMQRAIALAEQARWQTWPNPAVGAVLLRDGQIVAQGWHRAAGQDHAEVACLKDAAQKNIDPRGCTLVVTLEPCNHHGKTPPCTEAVLAAGIDRVVIGCADPNPTAAGGMERLRQAGIEVISGVCEQDCRDLLADFQILQEGRRPYVILKLASTLDGRIATRTGHSQWISNAASRRLVWDMRARLGAQGGGILIGGGTFRADDPSLTARQEGYNGPHPLACIVTSRLPQADADFRLLRERPDQTVFLASPAAAASTTAHALRQKGVRVLAVGSGGRGKPDFPEMLAALRQELGCPGILCEGGGQLGLSLLDAGFVDELHLHLAPIILGDEDALPLFRGRTPLQLEEGLHMRLTRMSQCEGDIHLLLRPAAPSQTGRQEN